MVEHDSHPLFARIFWPHLAGGCYLARNTRAAIEQAGFHVEASERFRFSPAAFLPADPHTLGAARRE